MSAGCPGLRARVAEAGRSSAPGGAVFDDDVGCRDEPRHVSRAFGRPEVEDDRALVGVVVPEVERAVRAGDVIDERADGARGRAFRRLDLHDVGAHVGEELPGELSELVAEFDDSESCRAGRSHEALPSLRARRTRRRYRPSTSRHDFVRVGRRARGGGAVRAGRRGERRRDAVEFAQFADLGVGQVVHQSRARNCWSFSKRSPGVWQTPAGTPAAWRSCISAIVLAARGPGGDVGIEFVLVGEAALVGGELRVGGPGRFVHGADACACHSASLRTAMAIQRSSPRHAVGVVRRDGGLPGAVAGGHSLAPPACGR